MSRIQPSHLIRLYCKMMTKEVVNIQMDEIRVALSELNENNSGNQEANKRQAWMAILQTGSPPNFLETVKILTSLTTEYIQQQVQKQIDKAVGMKLIGTKTTIPRIRRRPKIVDK